MVPPIYLLYIIPCYQNFLLASSSMKMMNNYAPLVLQILNWHRFYSIGEREAEDAGVEV